LIEQGLSCPEDKRRERAVELMVLLSGAVVMARAAGEPKLARQILASTRERAEHLISSRS
ncbi:MAG TPA: TetR/AcrR family transcriptional regulator, partial [Hyphomicrobium sp.]|nr:TetR/AcrR family transcriptional regulator [Hyphomicrobium sp.]